MDIVTSVVPYLALSVLIYNVLGVSVFLALALAIPTAGFLVRTFVVFHDCSHGSLLPSKRANAYVGRRARPDGAGALSPLAPRPRRAPRQLRRSRTTRRRGPAHADGRRVPRPHARGRLAYRAFRNPLVMFGIGPIIAMVIGPRIATRAQRPRMRHSVLLTDLSLLAIVSGRCAGGSGSVNFLIVWAPAALLAGSAGIWLFYVQHQFEDAYWESAEQWSYADAALRGSSYLKLPRVLQFFSANIGLHHVHHLNAKIPNYNLQRAHDENRCSPAYPCSRSGTACGRSGSKLWDEDAGRLVTFAQAARQRDASPGGSHGAGASASGGCPPTRNRVAWTHRPHLPFTCAVDAIKRRAVSSARPGCAVGRYGDRHGHGRRLRP